MTGGGASRETGIRALLCYIANMLARPHPVLVRPAFGGVAEAAVGLSPTQRESAAIIERELRAAGLPDVVIAAAIVNAYAESRLNPRARSTPPEDSVGLFQLNARGAGAGMSVAEREDPVANTRRIARVVAGASGAPIRSAWAARQRDLATHVRLWTVHIERPSAATVKGAARAVLGARLFPLGLPGSRSSVWGWMLLALVVAAGAGAIATRHRRRRLEAAA